MTGPEEPNAQGNAEVINLLPHAGTQVGAGRSVESVLVPARPPAHDRHPALVYLASLSEGSKRTMRASLENIARLVSADRADAWTLPWHELRYQHTAAIRSELAERYAPATANKMLSAMKGVLKECWRLGYITAEERDRAMDLSPIKGQTLPKGRSLSPASVRRCSTRAPRTRNRYGAPGTQRCSPSSTSAASAGARHQGWTFRTTIREKAL